jgi:ribose-phosphate pyrophosphokinase
MEAEAKLSRVPGTTLEMTNDQRTIVQSPGAYGRIIVMAGMASSELGQQIGEYLGTPLGSYTRTIFPNENIFIRLNESVRGQDVYVIQSMCTPLHENIFEMLIMIDTLKRDSAGRINVVIPYMPYGRSDKKDQPRVGIAARMLANIIETVGADRYMTIDLHAGQIQGFFNIPGDALTAFHLMCDYVKRKNIPDLTVCSTDLGYAKKARNWAERLATPLAIIEKRRTGNDSRAEALTIIGDVRDRNVLLVDDEVLTGGSAESAIKLVQNEGARDVYFAFTHAILAKDATDKLAGSGLKEIITTNTFPIPNDRRPANMTVLSVAPLLGEVIRRAHEGRSVGELFNE